ncbi:MAG: dTDP-4-dehydrorhamnose reductase, partial [Kiloniellales bacterium]|nr:dTDP-4-dehydrorhamnose reductase [Kiloniellales bacterium]
MQALVLGAGGQLGVEIVREMRERGHSVLGVGRSQLDITVAPAVRALLQRHTPRWVINCAAYNQVDLAEREPEKAMRINGLAVRTIAIACQEIGATLLHYSTDHVFDGSKDSPYVEEDLPSPPSAYAVSKLAGEHYARSNCDKTFIVRVAGVFGPAGRYTNRSNFPELVLRKAAAKEPLRVVEDFFATPTYAVPLAARSVDLLEKAPFGTYHIGGGETISWYAWARKIVAAAELEADLSPTNHREFVTAARRPRHASLSNAKIEGLGIDKMPSLDESLADYLRRRSDGETH